jgi:hypothetical protein
MSTALFEAVKGGDEAEVLSLLDEGADVNAKDKVKRIAKSMKTRLSFDF